VKRFNPEQPRDPHGQWTHGLPSANLNDEVSGAGFEHEPREHPFGRIAYDDDGNVIRDEHGNLAYFEHEAPGRHFGAAPGDAQVSKWNPFEARNAHGEWTNGELAAETRKQAGEAKSHLTRQLLLATADVIEHGKGAHADQLRDVARQHLGPKPTPDRHGGATVENLTGNFAF